MKHLRQVFKGLDGGLQRKPLGTPSTYQPDATLDRVKRNGIDPASLQFRLTAGLTILSILGLGSIATWTSWKMQQILIITHKQNVDYIASRFSRDVDLYSEMLPIELGVQNTINNLSAPNLLLWVRTKQGTLLGQSEGLGMSPQARSQLIALSSMPFKDQVYPIADRYMVLCSGLLTVRGVVVGQVHVAQDVTNDQQMLLVGVRSIFMASLLVTIATLIAIFLYVQRSLQPLRQINQMAAVISVDDLRDAKLQLDHAPSEVKELAQTLSTMLFRLSEAWEQQRQFVSNVSHELRTPLTLVQGYLQSVLRRGQNLSEPQREALETATSEAEHTVRLLQDLLDLARADSGYMHFYLEPIVLNDLIAEVVGMTERFSNRTIQITASDPAIEVETDRNRLRRVLINLIDNAVKYSEPEQAIAVHLEQATEQVLIQIQDQGRGIPLHQQSRIFERFYRVDEARARTTGGVGLGLSIVKTLVEGLGGHVTVRSKPDSGSTFTITLPT